MKAIRKFTLLMILTPGLAFAQDDQALQALAKSYGESWSRKEAAAVAAHYTADAVLTTPEGNTVRGSEEIAKALAQEMTGEAAPELSAHEFRSLGADAAVWRYSWKLTGTAQGTGLAVLIRTPAGWKIVEDLVASSPGEGEQHPHGEGDEHDHGGEEHKHPH